MLAKRGFTLLEIALVLVIMGVLTTIFFYSYQTNMNFIQFAYSKAAADNLKVIYTAQLHYFNDHNGNFCLGACGDTLPDLNTNLNLNMVDSGGYTYSCVTDTVKNTGFMCTAGNANTTYTMYDLAWCSGGFSCTGSYCDTTGSGC